MLILTTWEPPQAGILTSFPPSVPHHHSPPPRPPPRHWLQLDTGFVWLLEGVSKKAFILTPPLSRYRFFYVIERETTEAAIDACEAA